ncbi:MAG TPA: hypothetical protein VES67_04840 [Vicinamibacterales bacterium]|nr:hypothetical protein [Vicinamibacterales bacterium]
MSAALLFLWLLLTTPSVADNAPQQDRSDTVPRDLMAILLRGAGPGETFDLRVGPAPAGFPADLLPVGAVIGASAISPSMTTVVGTVPERPETARAAHGARLAAAGWVNSFPAPRGFMTTGPDSSVSVCRGNDFASISLLPRDQGGSYVRISLRPDPRRSCAPRPEVFFNDVAIPALQHPAGTKAYGTRSGGSADTTESSTLIDSPLDAAPLLEHYERQILAAGWTLVGRSASPTVATVARFSLVTARKEQVTAMLTITPVGQARFELSFRVFRLARLEHSRTAGPEGPAYTSPRLLRP